MLVTNFTSASDYQASVGRDLLRKCNERKSVTRFVQTYPGLMASWSRAQREKGRPGVVLLSDSFEYLHPANPNPPCGPACIVRPGYFSAVWFFCIVRLRCLRRKQNVRSIEPRLWLKAIHLNICSWGTPRSGPSARSNIFSLMDSLHYSSDPELLAAATHRACQQNFSRPRCANEPNPFFFRSWSYQYAGWVSATITQSIGFPWTITIPLSPSNYYRAPTSDPLIASRPISYTQLASSCYVHAPLLGTPVLIQRPQNMCGRGNKSSPRFLFN